MLPPIAAIPFADSPPTPCPLAPTSSGGAACAFPQFTFGSTAVGVCSLPAQAPEASSWPTPLPAPPAPSESAATSLVSPPLSPSLSAAPAVSAPWWPPPSQQAPITSGAAAGVDFAAPGWRTRGEGGAGPLPPPDEPPPHEEAFGAVGGAEGWPGAEFVLPGPAAEFAGLPRLGGSLLPLQDPPSLAATFGRPPPRLPDFAAADWPPAEDAALFGFASGPDAFELARPQYSGPAEEIFPAIGQYVGLGEAPETFGGAEAFLPELPGWTSPAEGFPVGDADPELSASRHELLQDVGQELLSQGRMFGQGPVV